MRVTLDDGTHLIGITYPQHLIRYIVHIYVFNLYCAVFGSFLVGVYTRSFFVLTHADTYIDTARMHTNACMNIVF